MTPFRLGIRVGVLVVVVVPMPRLPLALSPHVSTVPSDRSAKLLPPPAVRASTWLLTDATWMTPLRFTTWTGPPGVLEIVPLPRFPSASLPQDQTVPSCSSA